MNALINAMKAQLKTYGELHDLVVEEKSAIMSNVAGALEPIVERQKELMAELAKQEEARMSASKSIAAIYGLDESQITVTELANRAQPAQAQILTEIAGEMRRRIDEIKLANELNAKLLETQKGYIDFMLNAAVDAKELSNIYEKTGDREGAKTTSLGIFDKSI